MNAAIARILDRLRLQQSRSIALWLVLLAFSIMGIGLIDTINFTIDDTFISFRYAENLAAGEGLVFNPGERVEGYSNLLWTLMLAGFARMGWSQASSDVSLVIASKLAGVLLGFATLLVMALYVRRLLRRREWGAHSPLIALAVLCAAATYSFPLWSISGLETALAAFLLTLACISFARGLEGFDRDGEPNQRWLDGAGWTFGLLSLVRPEQIFIWALAMGAFVLLSPTRLFRPVLRAALPTLLIHVAMIAWRVGYYGDLLPNSVIAKMGGGLYTMILGAKYTLGGLTATIGFVAIGLVGLPRLLRGRTEWQFLTVFCTAFLLFLFVSGGDWMPGFRYHVPVLPILWLVTIASLLTFTSQMQPRIAAAPLVAIVAVLAFGSFASERSLVRSQQAFPTGFKTITWNSSPSRIEVAKDLRGIIPPGHRLALFEAGYIPYFNPQLEIMDNSGLMEPHIARMPGRHMAKMTAEYFLEQSPEFFLTMVKQGRVSGDALTLLENDSFRSRYERVKTMGAALRTDGNELASVGAEAPSDEAFVLYRLRSSGTTAIIP